MTKHRLPVEYENVPLTGRCIICLDARPNIASAGRPVHLVHCRMWLADGTTCVGCRGPLPRMKRQRGHIIVPTAHTKQQQQQPHNSSSSSSSLAAAAGPAYQHADYPEGLMRHHATTNSAASIACPLNRCVDTTDTTTDDTTTVVVDAAAAALTVALCPNRAATDCEIKCVVAVVLSVGTGFVVDTKSGT
jgi:hypothetical protein